MEYLKSAFTVKRQIILELPCCSQEGEDRSGNEREFQPLSLVSGPVFDPGSDPDLYLDPGSDYHHQAPLGSLN